MIFCEKKTRLRPPFDNSDTYIKFYSYNAAILIKGIAAFFVSTKFYLLFRQTAHKLCGGRPRCRSPPPDSDFKQFMKKSESEEKDMSEHKQFFIRVKEQIIPVTEEVYRTYYKMKRRELYLEERDAINGKVLYSDMEADGLLGETTIPDIQAKNVEQVVLDRVMIENLRRCLDLLPKNERELIDALFFKDYSERKWAEISGMPRKTIGDRRSRLLTKLKKLLEN